MTENKEDIRVRVCDYLSTDADHPRDSSELAFLLGTTTGNPCHGAA